MAFFRKTAEEPKSTSKKPPQHLREIVTDRVLTAEGWQRRTLSKVANQPKKNK
jgi:hypothetical protein